MSLEMLSGVQVGGASLNLLKGEEHLRLKRTLGDAFSEEAVEALAPVLQECTQLFCKRCAGSAHLQRQGPFGMYQCSRLAPLGCQFFSVCGQSVVASYMASRPFSTQSQGCILSI